MKPDINAYIRVMSEVKLRVRVAEAFLMKRVNAVFKQSSIECLVLQVRMALELIALGSLAANKEAFEQNRLKFAHHWKLIDIIRHLKRINPRFYPQPIREVQPSSPGGTIEQVPLEDGYLTQKEMIEIHGRCGDLLHARNPFKAPADYDWYWDQAPGWLNRLIALLSIHKIRLLDDDVYYVVQMAHEADRNVRIWTFERIEESGIVATRAD